MKDDCINIELNTKLPDSFFKPVEKEEFGNAIFNPLTPLTKGEEIAVRAMSAMLSNTEIVDRASEEVMELISRRAIFMADIMMKAFNERCYEHTRRD